MKLGIARTIQAHSNLLHIVRLDNYEQNIQKLTNSLTNFENFDGLQDSVKITKLKLTELNYKLTSLKPKLRNKRGLINGLGSVIKAITGNMDAYDAQRLNTEIESIISNQTNLKIEIYKQSKFNNKMIERFDNVTNHINRQQEIITKYLENYQKEINNKIRTTVDLLMHIQYLNQINYNIDILHDHLTSLSEAIVLARLNIISKHILSPDELTEIYYLFQNQSIKIKSDEHIYELLGLQAYYNDSNIIFNIRIPVMSNEEYSLFHIIPLPINHTKLISTKPYILLNTQNIQYFDEVCPKIENNYYCINSIYNEKINDSNCMAQLMNNNPADCKLIRKTTTTSISQPEPNYILLVNVPETEINSTCQFDHQAIKGTVLLHFENCEVQINGITYRENINTYWDEIHIYPSVFNHINTSSPPVEELNLEKLEKYHMEVKETIELLENKTQQDKIFTFGSITIIIFIIISITTYFYRIRNISTLNILQNEIPTPEDPTSAPANRSIKLLWPSLHS